MRRERTEEVLNRFSDYVIQQARSNLTRLKKNASKDLYKSLGKDLTVSKNSFNLSISAEDYWKYIDYGVKGTQGGQSKKGFRYTNKKPPVRFLQTWLKQKSGKFRQRNQRQIAFAIQNKIFRYGIKPTGFLSTPFERAFKSLPDEVIEAYGLDLEDFIEFTINKDV